MKAPYPLPVKRKTTWRKNRRVILAGFKDLAYLPKSRAGWNATLAAQAYSLRRQLEGDVDLNQWAIMHGCPASARYDACREDALVLWHGTSALRAEQIAQFGLFHKRGVWTTLEPKIAHTFSRTRAQRYRAGSATVVIVLDDQKIEPGLHYDQEAPDVFRFHAALPPECIEYILWDDRITFVGPEKAGRPRAWGLARFKKKDGKWVTLSQPPVRFDADHVYSDLATWLQLSIHRLVSTLGPAAAIEIFSSLYATIDPWEALEHQVIFDALERLCYVSRRSGGIKLFDLDS